MYFAALFVLCIFIVGSSPYKSTRVLIYNGQVYKESIEQPWFRYPHEPHPPIPLRLANETGFGKHELPDDDVFVEHEWTEEEKKYLPCLDLICACPYYGGKVSGSKCILSNGKLLQKAIRKEARQLSDSERFQIAIAFNKMKTAGIYDRIGFVHKYSGLHEGPGFFTWHREYLKRFELAFRRFLPLGSRLGLPYWDSSLESELPNPRESVFFSSLFVGATNSTGHIIDGPFSDWNIMEGTRRVVRFVPDVENGEVLNNARIDVILEQKKIENVLAAALPLETCKIIVRDDRLLSYSHDYVHYFINGDMRETFSSTSEPIFYFHHPMIDNIWEMWRQLRQVLTHTTPTPLTLSIGPRHLGHCRPVSSENNSGYLRIPTATRQSTLPMLLSRYYTASRLSRYTSGFIKELEPYTNEDVLTNKYTDNMYEYTKRPSCSKTNKNCRSKFLFCHKIEGNPQCIAKLREGADCRGFEKTPICYGGRCIEGRCVRSKANVGPDPKEFM